MENEQFPIDSPENIQAAQSIPLEEEQSFLSGIMIASILAYNLSQIRRKRLIEYDKYYPDIKKRVHDEWKKENPEKVGTDEELDFVYGKLDSDKPSLLKTKTEEAFKESHQARFERYKKNRDWNKNPKRDVTFNQYLAHQVLEIREHEAKRISYLRSLGNYKHWWNRVGKPEYKHKKNLISQKVSEKAWDDFVHFYPEKAREYSNGKKWYASQIKSALERMEARKTLTLTVDQKLDHLPEAEPKQIPVGSKDSKSFVSSNIPTITGDEKLDDELRSFYNRKTSFEQKPAPQPISQPSLRFQRPGFETARGKRLENLQGRGGGIDKLNRLINRGRKIKVGAGIKKQLAKKAASTVGKMALKNPYVLAALLIICAIVLLIILILGGGASQEQIRRDDNVINGTPIPGLTLTKTGPSQVDNGQNIKFTITVTYSGSDEILLVDEISANDGEIIKEGTTGILSGITSTRATWDLKANTPNNGTYSFDLMVKPLRENFNFKNTVIATDMTTQNLPPTSDLDGLLPQAEQTDLTMQKQKEVADLLSKPDNISNVIIYKEASQTTGIAWEILAGLHYREGSMNPNSSLVSGRKIGQIEPDVRFCEKEYQVGQPYRVGGGCVFKTLLDTAIYAGNHLKGKNFGNIPSTSAEIVLALSKYNGGGNSNCGDTPYPNCPPLYFGEDDTYVMNAYDKKHETMYIVYCADHVRCNPPKKDSRPGVLSAIIGVIKYMNN